MKAVIKSIADIQGAMIIARLKEYNIDFTLERGADIDLSDITVDLSNLTLHLVGGITYAYARDSKGILQLIFYIMSSDVESITII